MAINNESGYYMGYLSVGATAKTLLDAVPEAVRVSQKPRRVVFTVETAAIRYRYDGVAASDNPGGGHLGATNTTYKVEGVENVKNLSMIADTATAGEVTFTLEGG